jgi:hypothetical protein
MEPELNGNRLLQIPEYWIKISVLLPPKKETVECGNIKKTREFNN